MFPKWLMKDSEFSKMSNDAKVLYANLKDRFRLSSKNHWVDKQGKVFVICKRESMMKMLNKSENTIRKIMDELKKYELVEEVQNGNNKPNFIYLLMPALSDSENEDFEEDNWKNEEYEKPTLKICGSGHAEVEVPSDPQKLSPNNNEFYNVNIISNNQSISKEDKIDKEFEKNNFESYIRDGKPFEYLKYGDLVSIVNARVHANNAIGGLWHLNVNDDVKQKIINSFVSLMADVFECSDKRYKISKNKSYDTISFKQKLLEINESTFFGILDDLQDVNEIKNQKAYFCEMLYNASVNNSTTVFR